MSVWVVAVVGPLQAGAGNPWAEELGGRKRWNRLLARLHHDAPQVTGRLAQYWFTSPGT